MAFFSRQFVKPLLGGLILAALLCTGLARVISVDEFGAVPFSKDAAANNSIAFSSALSAAVSDDVVLFPPGKEYWALGGIFASNLVNITISIQGVIHAAPDLSAWPTTPDKKSYLDFFVIADSTGIVMSGMRDGSENVGVVDGHGLTWWDKYVLGIPGPERPKLIHFYRVSEAKIVSLQLLNSPMYHLLLTDVKDVEVGHVNVTVDRSVQRSLKQNVRQNNRRLKSLQPEDLNTDGIDPSGTNVWIHDCTIINDDDSIAVKPCSADTCSFSNCSQNMLIENMIMSGFGASIGSVPPHDPPHCVRNITFRNLNMPKTGKGIYIKSNPTCEGSSTGIIEDITYENVNITEPRWWPIWIGPQQQHEPGSALGRKCALDYPLDSHCPTQGCVTFRNILLKDVYVEKPWMSPGVILGNSTNPMENVVFENVVIKDPSPFPFEGKYKCENANVEMKGDNDPSVVCA